MILLIFYHNNRVSICNFCAIYSIFCNISAIKLSTCYLKITSIEDILIFYTKFNITTQNSIEAHISLGYVVWNLSFAIRTDRSPINIIVTTSQRRRPISIRQITIGIV